MKKFSKALSCVFGAAFIFASLSACADTGKCTLLAQPAEMQPMTYSERENSDYTDFSDKANSFAARLTEAVYNNTSDDENIALAPVSVFLALSMAAQCAGGNAREQILSALGVGEEEVAAGFGYLIRSLNSTYKTGKITAANSVWLQDGVEFIEDCISSLAEDYYCPSYSADFFGDNRNANNAVRNYVRENTEGLIDNDFELGEETLFVLINALYIKDNWTRYGDLLPLTQTDYTFTEADGSGVTCKLMQGKYNGGIAQKGENFTTFYTSSYNGYKLHFIVPDDGYSVREVFNENSISFVTSLSDYGSFDEENNVLHNTRCLFPEFSASYNGDLKDTLSSSFGITDIFDSDIISFTSIIPGGVYIDGPVFCDAVVHITKLSVDRRGMEGAAVTVIPGEGSTAAPVETVYHDFVVDKSFGYILSDYSGTILFTGVVNNI